jgi:hypothetical protein
VSYSTYVGAGRVNKGSVNEGNCPSPRPLSSKRRAESHTPLDSDYDDADFVDMDLDLDCEGLDGPQTKC